MENVFNKVDVIYDKHDIILTGSHQYGTDNLGSDYDIIVLHNGNKFYDLVAIDSQENYHKQIQKDDLDVTFMSYTLLARRLYRADLNSVEYVCSPYYKKPSCYIEKFNQILLEECLQSNFFKHKLLKSLLGFLNPTNRKRNKKWIIPEKINPNNIIKICNLFHLITQGTYPLNPQKGLDLVAVDLIDTNSINYNNTQLITDKFEGFKQDLEKEMDNRLFGEYSLQHLLQDIYD